MRILLKELNRILEDISQRLGKLKNIGDDNVGLEDANIVTTGTITGASLHADNGDSGYFDDGTNFRVTVVNGIITNIANSSAGGHS
jgi:hypothetical protein